MAEGGEMTFAERMMQKMGWSQGKGLGKDETGMKDYIKPKMKFNTKGIGFTGVDDKWIAHQEHFDDLLSSLNKGEKPAEKKELACLTSASKLRGRTKFYAKMMRGKDLSNRTSQDLSAIIVSTARKQKEETPDTPALPSEGSDLLKASKVSMNDYFSQIKEKRKSKSSVEADVGKPEEPLVTPDEVQAESKPEKKKKRKRVEDEASEVAPAEDESAPKKKSKKNKKPKEDVTQETISVSDSDREALSRKKKKSKACREELEPEPASVVAEESKSKKKSKKKKDKDGPVSEPMDNTIISTGDITSFPVEDDLLEEIRGKKLKPSKAEATRRILTDEEIKDVYHLWTSGQYGEFMRRVHAGELPRWVALEKRLVDKMVGGRTKMVQLGDVRDLLATKWKGDNSHEIWGYTNLPYLVLEKK